MSELLTYFQKRTPEMIDLLTTLVSYETPTGDKTAVDKLGVFMQRQFTELGASSIARYPREQVGDFLLAKWNESAPGRPILFIVHIDTVWPTGTLARRPVTIDAEGRLFGPGAVDMKGGITIMLTALRGLIDRRELPARPLWALMTTDEETGSVHSKALIEELAPQAGLVLIMEPATPEEALKTWRKGVAVYALRVKGRASHAGNAPEQGVNAIIEMAQQALDIHALNDLRHGTSVSVTMVCGGTAGNVIPAKAWAHIDVRMLTAEANALIHERMMSRQAHLPGAEVTVEYQTGRGPMERNARMVADFGQCRAIGEKYGLTVYEDGSGGGSDGNITASLGVSTLDGLGPQGDGLHAEHEHVVINSLPRRATLIAGMLKDWVFEEARSAG